MKQTFRDWLPASAMTDSVICRCVDDVVNEWSRDWFATKKFAISRNGGLDLVAAENGGAPRICGSVVAVYAAAETCKAIAAAALGGHPPSRGLTNRDIALIDAFAIRPFADLANRMSDRFGHEGATSGTDADDDPSRIRVRLTGSAPKTGFSLDIETGLVARFRRRLSAPTSVRSEDLDDRLSAIEDAPVEIGVGVGQARLSLAEMQSLEKGDVIVLDRPAEQGAALFAVSNRTPVASGRIVDEGDRLRLHIY